VAVLAMTAVLAGCSAQRQGDGGTPSGRPRAATTGDATAEQHRAQRWLASLVPWGFRGAVALRDGDDVLLAAGFGPLDPATGAEEAIGPDTRFAIGSITKDFVDIAIRLLQDRGDLRTSDRLSDLLPRVPPDKAGITVDQLMTHTAGFEHVHGDDDEQISKEEALERIFAQELRFEPGTDEYYSNSGYTLLAAIIEEVSGRDIGDVLREEIFAPTGMTSTGFKGDPVPARRDEAVGLDAEGRAAPPSEGGPIGWTLQGNGGIVSTVNDMLAFDRAICDGVLPDSVVQQLYHCGDKGAYGSAGGGSEYSHTATLEKDLERDMTLVVLSADWDFSAEDVAFALIDSLLEGGDLPAVPEVAQIAPDTGADIAGTYESETGATVTVRQDPAGIRLVTEDGEAFDDLFALPDEIPDIAPIDEVVRLAREPEVAAAQMAESTGRAGGWGGWPNDDPELGSLLDLEPVGVAPTGEYEPLTYLRARFEHGSKLTAWIFSPDGEWLYGDLEAEPPGVTFRPGVRGDFVSFTLRDMSIADRVTFDDDTMTIAIEGRAVDYRRTS
jgi:CubicO group peptidase (beta-lactamase class C family)